MGDLDECLLPIIVVDSFDGSYTSELQLQWVSPFAKLNWQSGEMRVEDTSRRNGPESWVFNSIDEQAGHEVAVGTWPGLDAVCNKHFVLSDYEFTGQSGEIRPDVLVSHGQRISIGDFESHSF